jgi:polar amino acid transport system substrate-binding protein
VLSGLSGARILLVEDNELNQELTCELLSMNGLEVDVAGDGLQALQALENKAYDGILMDCQMPVMDGFEATSRIRALPEYANLPIIAITANVMAGDIEKVLGAGMNDYISKPIDPAAMFGVIAKWVVPSQQQTPKPENPQLFERASDGRPYVALRELLVANDCDAIELVEAMLNKGEYRNQYEALMRISVLLADFEFDQAIQVLESIKLDNSF